MNVKIAKKILIGCMLAGMTCFLNADELADKMPPLEQSFIDIIYENIDKWEATTNAAKKLNIDFDLQKSLYSLIKGKAIKDWVGIITSIRTDDSDGSARVGVTIFLEPQRRLIVILTLDNKASDNEYHIHTGIDIGTDLYNAVSELEVGDEVVFSGRFISLLANNLYSRILEEKGVIVSFSVFKFTSIKKTGVHKKLK